MKSDRGVAAYSEIKIYLILDIFAKTKYGKSPPPKTSASRSYLFEEVLEEAGDVVRRDVRQLHLFPLGLEHLTQLLDAGLGPAHSINALGRGEERGGEEGRSSVGASNGIVISCGFTLTHSL